MRAMAREQHMSSADTAAEMFRQQAAALYAEQGFPGKKDERWRYSAGRFAAAVKTAQAEKGPFTPALAQAVQNGLPDYYALNDARAPFSVSALDSAEEDIFSSEWLQDGADALHFSSAGQGVVITVPEGVQCDKPLYLARGGQSGVTHIFRIGAGASFTVIEYLTPEQTAAGYVSDYSAVNLAEGASFTHYLIAETGAGVCRRYGGYVRQQSRSRYHAATLVTGDSGAFKYDNRSVFDGAKAAGKQYAAAALSGDALCDFYLPAHHIAPGCSGYQRARIAAAGKATGVYYGRASVIKEAVDTEAHQINKNLLLSNKARIYSRPELDILTDRIACTHGSATGTIDEEALYYMQARGITKAQALAMLNTAFLQFDEAAVADEAIRALFNAAAEIAAFRL